MQDAGLSCERKKEEEERERETGHTRAREGEGGGGGIIIIMLSAHPLLLIKGRSVRETGAREK